jgi:hypothetical protein
LPSTVFEWYDFYLYATLAPFFAALFLPKGNDTAALLSAFATYGRIVNGIVGESIGLIRDIAPAGKILQVMVNEAEAILRNRPSACLSE